jgi:serine/threonine protein kinase
MPSYTQKKNRRHPKRGGRFVSQGAYGCTFRSPPLKCKNEPTRRGETVISKYTRFEGIDKEYALSQKFRELDPTETYFLTVNTRCELNRSSIVPENEFEKCRLKNTPGALLLSTYGGLSFYTIVLTSENLLPVLESLPNLLKGISLAHEHQLYHLDIKAENIVSMQTPQDTVLTRYIDFGLSRQVVPPVSNFKDYFNQFSRVYAFYPFEDLLMYAISNNLDWSKETLVEKLTPHYKQWCETMTKYHPNVSLNFIFQDGKPYQSVDAIRTDLAIAIESFGEPDKTVQYLYSKCDTFGLGMVLADLFRKLDIEAFWDTTQSPPTVDIRFVKPSTTKIEFVLNHLDRFPEISPDIVTYFKKVKRHVFGPLYNLIGDMTDVLVSKRISIVDAMREYQTILASAKKLFTPELLNRYFVEGIKLYTKMQQDEKLAERAALIARSRVPFPAYQEQIGLNIFGAPPFEPQMQLTKRKLNFTNNRQPLKTARRRGTPMPNIKQPTIYESNMQKKGI